MSSEAFTPASEIVPARDNEEECWLEDCPRRATETWQTVREGHLQELTLCRHHYLIAHPGEEEGFKR